MLLLAAPVLALFVNAAILVGAKHDPIDTLRSVWADRFTAMAPFPPLPAMT